MPRDITDVHVGHQIRKIRKARRLSLEELGAAIGTTYQQVQKYEAASNRVSASQLWRIANALGVCPGSFFPVDEDQAGDAVATSSLRRMEPEIRRLVCNLINAVATAEKNVSAHPIGAGALISSTYDRCPQ